MPISFDQNRGKEIPAQWNPAVDFKDFPDQHQFSKWCEYDKKRYYAYKKSLAEGKTPKKESLEALLISVAKLKLDNKKPEVIEFMTALEQVKELMSKDSQAMTPVEKIFGVQEVPSGTYPSSIALYKGPKDERQNLDEDLGKFISRVGSMLPRYTVPQLKDFIKKFNESSDKQVITLSSDNLTLTVTDK